MSGKKNESGGQGSSGGSNSGGGYTGDYYTDDEVDDGSEDMPFGFPGSGADYSWTDKDYDIVEEIIGVTDENGELVSGIEKLQQEGRLKTKDDIKRYLNELMEDGGVTLSQYQALKAIYGID